jgi:DNA-binding MarR family transcriptional regulator
MAESLAIATPAAHAVALIGQIGRAARACRKAGPLNDVQWEALHFLALANRFSRNPGALAAWLGVTKGRASQTVDALAKQGLILRLPDPRDGRGLALELSQAGRRMAEKDPLRAVAAALSALPTAQAAAVSDALARALAALQRDAGRRAFAGCGTCRHFRPAAAMGETAGPHRCGLTGEGLNDDETRQICALHAAAA